MRKDWEYKKFEECIQKVPKTPKIQSVAYKQGSKYPIISQEENTLISGYCDDESLLFHIKSPVVIFGDHTRALKYVDFDFAIGADGVKIISPKTFLNAKFLLYFLKWYNIPSLGYSRHYKLLKELSLPIPMIEQQLTIVAELDKLNEMIRLKKQQLEDYDQLAQSIFYEMFGDPVENEKGWKVKKLEEAVATSCTISYGIVQPGEHVLNGVPVVRPVDLGNTFVKTTDLKCTTIDISNNYSRTILTGDEILVCVRGTTGIVSLATSELKGCNVTRGITPLLFDINNKWFMYAQFKTASIQHIIASNTKGIALKQINMGDLRNIRIILPPLPLQQQFAARIEAIEQQKQQVKDTIKDLETLLASRMQYWFD